jgi:integrase
MNSPEQIPLFVSVLDMRAAEAVQQRIMQAQLAKNTIRNYHSSWSSFQHWCREVGARSELPVSPQLCVDHASWCIAAGLRLETVQLRFKAINHVHRKNGLDLPIDNSVRQFMRNARRDLCERPQGKEALTPDQLRRISRKLRTLGNPLDIRDRSVVLLCFACGWRCSELVSLDLRDLNFVEEGIVLRLGKSKTDQEARGRTVGVQWGKRVTTCPLLALEEWLTLRGDWGGPLFTRLDGRRQVTRERLDSDAVRRAVKRGLDLIGEDSESFGAHSLRAGMITASAEAGATETAIMQRTGHRRYDSLRRYVRPAQVFRVNPLRGVL